MARREELKLRILKRQLRRLLSLLANSAKPEISTLLTLAAQNHPGVMTMLNDAVIAMRERERSCVITFDHYSRSIWREINVAYRSMRGGAQYDQSFEVASDVANNIDQIVNQCGPNVNPQTRLNGLSVLRKIGKTVCLSSGDVIAHEVRKSYEVSSALVEGMCNIIDSMDVDEIQSIRDQTDSEIIYPKLLELHKLAEDYGIFGGLEEAIAMPGEERDEGDEDEEDDEEDGEYQDNGEDGYEDGKYGSEEERELLSGHS